MMIYTTYFANIKNCNGVFYAVSGYIPKFYQDLIETNQQKYKRYIDLAPKKYWWQQWKNGKLNNDQFIRLYYETVLNNININDVMKQFAQYREDIFLLCYQKPNDFCHRHLICQWLKNNNMQCKEFQKEKQQLELF